MDLDEKCVVCGKQAVGRPFCDECARRERPTFLRAVGIAAALSWAAFLTGLLGLTAWKWPPFAGAALTAAGIIGLYEALKLYRKRRTWFR